jgi:hypothetical protein
MKQPLRYIIMNRPLVLATAWICTWTTVEFTFKEKLFLYIIGKVQCSTCWRRYNCAACADIYSGRRYSKFLFEKSILSLWLKLLNDFTCVHSVFSLYFF